MTTMAGNLALAGERPSAPSSPPAAPPAVQATTRLLAIDALRGFVMVVMLLDHVRETFFLHMQVSDPVDARTVMPALFFTRHLSTICAPVFVALTGMSAWLYGQKHSRGQVSDFLLRRGLFLLFLEVTFVGFAWTASFPPTTAWLQVIWAIGISMICLAGAIHLPRAALIAIGAIIVCGHNLLDGIVLAPNDAWYVPWAMLHQRGLFTLAGITIKTTYPVLPWIGLIMLGYAAGPLVARNLEPAVRQRRLLLAGAAMLAAWLALRSINLYGDRPWYEAGTPLRTLISFLAATKYPPSLLFLLPTVGVGALLMVLFERAQHARVTAHLALLGGAPMFFYLLHLYVLKALYLAASAAFGANHGPYFGFDGVGAVWACYLLLIVPLYYPTRWFAKVKQRRKDIWWLKYL